MTPSITVLISTYDRPAKLRRALASCFAQRVPPEQVLVIDNGENPATPRVVADFQAQHGAKLVYAQSERFNLRRALARGIELATSEWLIILDDDDFLTATRLEEDRALVSQLPADVVMLAHNALRVDYARGTAWHHRLTPEKLTLESAVCFENFGGSGAACLRTALVKKHHPFHLAGGVSDYDLHASLLQHGRAVACELIGLIVDDTRDTPRLTLVREGLLPDIALHRERYRTVAAQRGLDPARVHACLSRQLAFHAGKSLGWRTLASPYAAEAGRHPVEFAKGLLAPRRPAATRLLRGLLPAMRGSRQVSFATLERTDPALASWIQSARESFLVKDAAQSPHLDLGQNRAPWTWRTKVRRGVWMLCWHLLFRPTPKRLGNPFRIWLLRVFGARVGQRCLISPSVRILQPWELEIGDFSALGATVDIYNFGRVTIGSQTVVSQRTYVCTGSHDYEHPHFTLIWEPITIGDSVWIAAEVFLHPGVTIGEGAVIGARAVVTQSMPPWMVCAGHPCRPLKPRKLRPAEGA